MINKCSLFIRRSKNFCIKQNITKNIRVAPQLCKIMEAEALVVQAIVSTTASAALFVTLQLSSRYCCVTQDLSVDGLAMYC